MNLDWYMEGEQRQAVEPHLEVALRYLPPWVQSVTVRYDPTEENLCSVGVQVEYRQASIRIGDGWFSETTPERRVALVHEVIHGHIETLAVVFGDLLDALASEDENAALRTWAKEQWRRAEEGVCCDLSRVLAAAHG